MLQKYSASLELLNENKITDKLRNSLYVNVISGKHTYVRTTNEILCFANGKQTWNYAFQKSAYHSAVTILSDNSLLAISDSTLVHLLPDGTIRKTFTWEKRFTCNPIVDEEGSVYCATETGIIKIR